MNLLGHNHTMPKKNTSRECANCLSADLPLTLCARCRLTHYCGKPCQVQHWKSGHKERCVPLDARKPAAEVRNPGPITCAICLDALLDAVCKLPCGHAYHKECVEGLRKFGVKQACPSCRAALPPGAGPAR